MSQPQTDDPLLLVAGELNAIGQRLTYLGSVLHTHAANQASTQQQPQPAESAAKPDAPQAAGLPRYPRPETPAVRPRFRMPANLEPSRVLAWVGAGVTLLGVVFLLVLAVQQDWIGPPARIGAGGVLAIALTFAGWWVHSKSTDGRIAGIALATTGFAALFLDIIAATTLYRFLSASVGLGVGLVVALGGLLLADRWRAQSLGIGVVLGSALCAPLITGEPTALLIAFLGLLHIAATPIQIRRGWAGLAVVAGVPVVLAALAGTVWALSYPDNASIVTIFAASVVGVVVAVLTAGARPDADRTTIGLLIAAPTPAFLAGPMLLDRIEATATGGGLALLLTVMWGVGRYLPAFDGWLSDRFLAAVGALAMVAAAQATASGLDSTNWATALLCEALLLAIAGYLLQRGGFLLGATVYALVGFLLALGEVVPIDSLLWFDRGAGVSGVVTGLLIAVVAVVVPASAVGVGKLATLPNSVPVWSAALVAVLYGTASATMAACLLASPSRDAFLVGHILITLCWVVAAIALLLRGVQIKHLRVAGLVLTAVSLAKLLLFDLATLDGFARVVAFLCAGLILLAAGVGYARMLGREAGAG